MTLSPRPWPTTVALTVAPADDRLTDPDAVAFADHQHLVEDDLRADVCRELFDLELLAGGDLVLLATGFYDRVHAVRSAECWLCRVSQAAEPGRSRMALCSDRGKPYILSVYMPSCQRQRFRAQRGSCAATESAAPFSACTERGRARSSDSVTISGRLRRRAGPSCASASRSSDRTGAAAATRL